MNLRDAAESKSQLGECDQLINQIRRELELPERVVYAPQIRAVMVFGREVMRAELMFVRRTANAERGRVETLYLTWDASKVAHSGISAF